MYRPIQRPQIGDPTTTLDSYICTMESGAMALDFHTLGGRRLWGGQLVPYCGLSRSYIVAHGTNLKALGKAWAYYGNTLTNKTLHTFADLLADLHAGRGVILQGDYDQFSYQTRCQDSFTGNHAIYLNPEFSGTKILMQDPLCKSPKFVEAYELRKYAEKLGRAVLGTSSPQKIFYAVTAAHPDSAPAPVPTSHSIKIAPYATIYKATISSSGCISGWTTQKWGSTASSAPCFEITRKPGCSSGSADVVYVPKGTFAGKWVRIGTGVTYV